MADQKHGDTPSLLDSMSLAVQFYAKASDNHQERIRHIANLSSKLSTAVKMQMVCFAFVDTTLGNVTFRKPRRSTLSSS
jgi:hypothetical protein